MDEQVLINGKVLTMLLANRASLGRNDIPNPDDPDDDGPYGPWGPWIRVNRKSQLVTQLANEVIQRAIAWQQMAEQLPERELQKQFNSAINGNLAAIVDDWCGTKWPRWPFPWPPPPWLPERPDSIDLLTVGFQFQQAAEMMPEGELREFLNAGGSRMIEQGLAGS